MCTCSKGTCQKFERNDDQGKAFYKGISGRPSLVKGGGVEIVTSIVETPKYRYTFGTSFSKFLVGRKRSVLLFSTRTEQSLTSGEFQIDLTGKPSNIILQKSLASAIALRTAKLAGLTPPLVKSATKPITISSPARQTLIPISPIPLTKIGKSTVVITRQVTNVALTQSQFTGASLKQSLAQIQFLNLNLKLKTLQTQIGTSRQASNVGQILAQAQSQIQTRVTTQVFKQIIPTPITPKRPFDFGFGFGRRTQPFGFVPSFDLGFGEEKGRARGKKRRFRRLPSLISIELGFKDVREALGEVSGLVARPILK